jgi:hypothetical protein
VNVETAFSRVEATAGTNVHTMFGEDNKSNSPGRLTLVTIDGEQCENDGKTEGRKSDREV